MVVDAGRVDRVQTDPVQRLYKRIWPGSGHFFLSFLFLLSPVSLLLSSSPIFSNPNPNLATQNPSKHALTDSSCCSEHKFTVEIHMQILNRCRSWKKFFSRFQSVLVPIFFCMNFYEFVDLQRLIFVVDHGIFTVFKSFRVSPFLERNPSNFHGFT